MPSFSSLLPPWRDTLTETTTVRYNIIDSEGDKMAIETRGVMNRILPKQDKDNAFDLVVRPSFGRAILTKGSELSSATDASQILTATDAYKANRMKMTFDLAMKFSAQRAEQKAKLSAQRAEQKARLSAQRAAQLSATMDAAARFREQGSILRAQRIAAQTKLAEHKAAAQAQRAIPRAPFIKAVSIVATLAAAGAGLATWKRHGNASKGAHVPSQATAEQYA